MGSGYPAVKSSRLNPSTLKGLFSFSQKEFLPITYDAFLSICVGGIALNGRPDMTRVGGVCRLTRRQRGTP